MKESDDLFNSLVRTFAKDVFLPDEKDKGKDNRVLLYLLGILLFVGAEGVKVMFRNNFGKQGLNLFRVILCTLVFWGIALISYVNFDDYTQDMYIWGSQKSLLYTAGFYSFFGLFVLIKGIIEYTKAIQRTDIHPYYKGDSYILASILSEKISNKRLQMVEEPFLVLSVGVFLSGFNFILGIPLFFCAVSVWGYQIYERFSGHSDIDKVLEQKGYTQQQGEQFSEIKF